MTPRQKILFGVWAMILAMVGDYLLGFGTFGMSSDPSVCIDKAGLRTFALHDIFSKSKYGDMKAFVRKLNNMGYEKVQLIDTTNGKFMTKWESRWMGLSGSAILIGKK